MLSKIGALVFLLFSLFGLLSTNQIYGQKVSLSVESQPLSQVLQSLSDEYNVKIAFDTELASRTMVSATVSNLDIFEVVEVLLDKTTLEAIQINDVIVIRPKLVIEEKPEPALEIPISHKISGVIQDRANQERLPYATVVIVGTSTGVSANSDGYFTLFTDRSDSIVLRFSYLGFNPIDKKVFPAAIDKPIVVELQSQEIEIPDAIVVKRQPDIVAAESTPGLFRWNSNRNTDIPSLNGLDIAAPLQLLPGIDGSTENLSGLIVRKLPSDKNLFVYDGFTVYHIDHFLGAFTSFNAKSVKDIRIFKSGFDARWGGRASSVIEITGKSGNASNFSADMGIDLLSADLLIEGPLGDKVTFLLSGRRSFTDFFRSRIYYQYLESARADINNESASSPSFLRVDEDEPSYLYYDANAKLTYRPTSKDMISLSLFVGNDIMSLDRQTQFQTLIEDSDWGNNGAGIRWSRQWSNQFNQHFTLGVSQYHLDFLHSDTTLRRRQNSTIFDHIVRKTSRYNKLNDLNVNINSSLKVNANNEIQFGLQANGVDLNLDESVTQLLNSVPVIDTTRTYDQKMFVSTLWGQHIFNYGRIKALTYGARVNYYTPTGLVYAEPRGQLSVTLTPKSYLKFSAGRYYQFINQILTISESSYNRLWTIADGKKLPVVSSNHFTAGLLVRLPLSFTLDIEGYSRNTLGITTVESILRRTGNGNRIQEQLVYYNITNRTKGLDVMLHKEFSFAQIWLAYTLSKSKNESENLNNGLPYPSLADQLHEVKLAGTGRWKGWGFSFAAIYGSGKPWDEPLFTGTMQLSEDYEKNSNRLPQYLRLDTGMSYAYKFKGIDLKIGVNLFNILGYSNKLARLYALSDTPIISYLQTGTPLVYSDTLGMGFAQSFYFNLRF